MLCKRCCEYKLPMDMHDLELCKNCWSKQYDKKYQAGNKKAWDARRVNKTVYTKNK